MGILQFSKTYGEAALEAACAKARAMGSCTYTTVKGIVKNGVAASQGATVPDHENIRGSGYYK
jgi:hypothetical protein